MSLKTNYTNAGAMPALEELHFFDIKQLVTVILCWLNFIYQVIYLSLYDNYVRHKTIYCCIVTTLSCKTSTHYSE